MNEHTQGNLSSKRITPIDPITSTEVNSIITATTRYHRYLFIYMSTYCSLSSILTSDKIRGQASLRAINSSANNNTILLTFHTTALTGSRTDWMVNRSIIEDSLKNTNTPMLYSTTRTRCGLTLTAVPVIDTDTQYRARDSVSLNWKPCR